MRQTAANRPGRSQLVVVHPEMSALGVLGHDVREAFVGAHVRLPVPRVRRNAGEHVVQERPEHAVRESFIEAACFARRQIHGHDAQLRELLVQVPTCVLVETARISGPADPEAVSSTVRTAQAGGEPAGARNRFDATARGADRDRQSVRDEHDPAGRHAVLEFRLLVSIEPFQERQSTLYGTVGSGPALGAAREPTSAELGRRSNAPKIKSSFSMLQVMPASGDGRGQHEKAWKAESAARRTPPIGAWPVRSFTSRRPGRHEDPTVNQSARRSDPAHLSIDTTRQTTRDGGAMKQRARSRRASHH